MHVKKLIHLPAVFVRGILEMQQAPHLMERHVERTTMPYEDEPFKVLGPVGTVVAVSAPRRGQQSFTLVISNCFNLTPRAVGELSDFHADALPFPSKKYLTL